jgi:hypothetical protein
MRLKCRVGLLFIMVLLVASMLFFKNGYSNGEKDIVFEILEKGDVSGCCEENYVVVGNEDEWVSVWERHALIREPAEPPPEIDFSKFMVVCAFMGRRPTTGYSIDIKRIWTDGEKVFVEVVKSCPPEGLVVCEMVTCPYVMVLVERTDMHFVFQVVDENGGTAEYVLSEFPLAKFAFLIFAFLLAAAVTLKIKKFK